MLGVFPFLVIVLLMVVLEILLPNSAGPLGSGIPMGGKNPNHLFSHDRKLMTEIVLIGRVG